MLGFLKKTIKVSLVVMVIFSITNITFAQIESIDQSTKPLEIIISPEKPKGGDTVDVELNSYNINLETSKITWFVDGLVKKDGLALKTFSFVVDNDKESTVLRVRVIDTSGTIQEVYREIKPAGVDLVLEPISYVPSFYKGKPMFTNQGIVRVIALPNIILDNKKIESKSLIFKWRKDGAYLPQNSGLGKNSILVTGKVPINDINIDVEILDSSNTVLTSNSILIVAGNPKIIFYEKNSLYGILYNKALIGDYYLGLKEELNVIAKPFFFSVEKPNTSDLFYKWLVNQKAVILDGAVDELLLKQTTENLKGTASISLDINNKNRIFQFTNSSFNVTFGQ